MFIRNMKTGEISRYGEDGSMAADSRVDSTTNDVIEAAKAKGRAQGIAEARAEALSGGTTQSTAQNTMCAVDQMLASIPIGSNQNSRIGGVSIGSGSSLVENARRRSEAFEQQQAYQRGVSYQIDPDVVGQVVSLGNGGSLVDSARKRALIAAQQAGVSLAEVTRI